MPTVRSTIHIENRFGEITAAVNDLARRAVHTGAVAGGREAATRAAGRSKTGRMAAIQVTPPYGTVSGWEASFQSPVFYAWFQNYGTLGNRDKPLKGSPRTDRTREPGTGVEPLHFLDAGRRVGRKAMLQTLNGGL